MAIHGDYRKQVHYQKSRPNFVLHNIMLV